MTENYENVTYKNHSSLSKNLLRFAWTVEVFAVITGLFIAGMIGIDTLNKIIMSRPSEHQTGTTADYINTIIAVLPFVLVAVVELAKIPVAQAAYTTVNRVWKTVFFLTLVFLAMITFETTLNGFERNFSNLTFIIEKYKDELDTTSQKISEFERQKLEAEARSALKIEENYNNRRLELTSDRDKQINQITNRIAELKASVKTERTTALQDELKLLQNDLAQIRQDKIKELERVVGRSENQLNSATAEVDKKREDLKESINLIDSKITAEKLSRQSSLDKAGFFESEDRIRKEYDSRINQYENERKQLLAQLNGLSVSEKQNNLQRQFSEKSQAIDEKYALLINENRNRISTLNNEIAKSIALVEDDIKGSVNSLYEQQKTVEAKFEQQLTANSNERERQFSLLKSNQETIDLLNLQLVELNNLRVDLRNRINAEVGNNQVYRLTRSWTGAESSADITRSQVAITATVWFGSLAAIVALTGILLALASCVIGNERQNPMRQISRYSFNRSYRSYLAYKLKLIKHPKIIRIEVEKPVIKEVIKEVPVDKVVIKEVPREIIKNVLIHVPMYTNDKSLLKDSY